MKIYDSTTKQTYHVDGDDFNDYLKMKDRMRSSVEEKAWFELGRSLRWLVNEYIDGRYTMGPMDAGALMRAVALSPGDYLEIGSLQGGSACIAGLAQKITGSGVVYCVDPFGWFTQKESSKIGPEPSPEVVIRNAQRFGVGDLIRAYAWAHPPLPPELQGKRFGCIFIDGDHSYDAALSDWLGLHELADRYVLLHDWNLPKHGVGQMLKEIQSGGWGGEGWQTVYQHDKMAVLERKNYHG